MLVKINIPQAARNIDPDKLDVDALQPAGAPVDQARLQSLMFSRENIRLCVPSMQEITVVKYNCCKSHMLT